MNDTNHQCDSACTQPESGGDDSAWLAGVFRDHERPLMGYAKHLLGDPDRASDVVQDTFVRLCKQPRERVEDCVRQWLYRVCRNRVLDVIKKEKRMKTLDNERASAEPSRESDPQRAMVDREDCAQADSLISRLPARQQEVIRLKVQGGLSYREISELTGLSVSNVGYLLSTGLQSVRSRLAAIQ
ncbi:MAG: sigma-70 family RNA polymerase sigma factor [Pirellulaceae bacterium]|nr:sigma-70 family RNA polymerase sigma factor [Pirellulaceae bacterium]